MRTRVAANYEAMGKEVAAAIVSEIKRRPNLLLCASAGGTPTHAYKCLAAEYARNSSLFRKLRVLQIDEWGGVPRNSPVTCETDLRGKLVSPLLIPAERFVGFRSNAPEPATECRRISSWLARHGPIDICILGLGLNGHVAMNEPGPTTEAYAHVAKLARSSQRHAMLKDLPRKPTYGLTLGLGEILQSRQIFLLVSGKNKRTALRRLLNSKVNCRFPASFLWLHSNVTIFCDREALDEI